MSNIQRLALIIAAHNHVALEDSEADSLALYLNLKQQAEADSQLRIDQLDVDGIPGQYDLMTVFELVEMIELEATQLVSFSNKVIEAAHQGLMDAAEQPGFEMDATRWSLVTFAETRLGAEQANHENEAAQHLLNKLSALHPEKQWSLFPIGDYCQFADADAPDVLVSFGCDEQELDSGLVDPFSTMAGDVCKPAAWGLSDEAAQLMRAFNKVSISKYPNCDGPKQA
ncbi:hypothetical protein NPS53_08925 [Pseudomonas putida]|uniref:hypothetical protein n=1 Tax=Pseudomonas putida TaxID=303 RepID=UPI0023639AC8|nr:hypothetical protein [Pseudomonas putida]MDD2139697.1 hypothetical protein [Pseudomonas putida]HDS1721621.1 hypothetical protein [Pseudomonas putida]